MTYRLNVGIMLINNNHKIFVASRKGQTDSYRWQMPQGGIDENENPFDAAKRELFEETGIREISYISQTKNWYTYDFPDWIPEEKRKKWSGQKQKWFLFLYTGLNIQKDFSSRQDMEFDDFQWVEKDFLINHIVPFKKNVYLQVLDEFESIITKKKHFLEITPAE